MDHAAAEMLEEPFIRVSCHSSTLPHMYSAAFVDTTGTIRVDAPQPSSSTAAGGKGLYVSTGTGFRQDSSRHVSADPLSQATVKSITKLSANDESDEARAKTKEEALQKLRAGIERIKGLKRKVRETRGRRGVLVRLELIGISPQIEAIQPSASEPSPLKARLDVLSDLQNMTTVSDSDPQWLKCVNRPAQRRTLVLTTTFSVI